MNKSRALSFLLLLFIISTNGMFVIMKEGQPRCFRCEVPEDTLIVGEFTSEPLTNEAQLGSSHPVTNQVCQECQSSSLICTLLHTTITTTKLFSLSSSSSHSLSLPPSPHLITLF